MLDNVGEGACAPAFDEGDLIGRVPGDRAHPAAHIEGQVGLRRMETRFKLHCAFAYRSASQPDREAGAEFVQT
ncbi:MAG: hypothetical protein NTZ14_11180, partial [Hyphomicrobiales bacterium]|nr:hypothetical protein [Hyphomicrobiales bacterium]